MDSNFGWTLNPMFGAAAMSLSSFCVVTNALRLNLFKIHDAVKDKKVKNPVSIEPILEILLISLKHHLLFSQNHSMQIKLQMQNKRLITAASF